MDTEYNQENLLQHYLTDPSSDEKSLECPKCGREGCTCGPDCDCETEEAQADITEQKRNKKTTPVQLAIDFE